MGVRGPAERREVMRAAQDADHPTGAVIGAGLQIECSVADGGDAGHRLDQRLLHSAENQVLRLEA